MSLFYYSELVKTLLLNTYDTENITELRFFLAWVGHRITQIRDECLFSTMHRTDIHM